MITHAGTTVGFIGSSSRLFQPPPRTSIVPGLARSRFDRLDNGNNIESQPLISIDEENVNENGTNGRKSTPCHHHRAPDHLAPDSPWDDAEGGEGHKEEDEYLDEENAGFVFVRPEFISVPQESPKF